jgi:hypothetical protein
MPLVSKWTPAADKVDSPACGRGLAGEARGYAPRGQLAWVIVLYPPWGANRALEIRAAQTLSPFYFPELGKFIPGPKKHSYALIFPSFTLK